METLPRVLIVDQERGLEATYDDFKTISDYECTIVLSTDAALKLIVTDPPDIIVADIPEIVGGEKISELAQKFNLPIVFASRFKDYEYERVPPNARIINKPFRGIDLKFAVRSELFKRKTITA